MGRWEPYRPCRREGQCQVRLTFLVFSTVLLKRDLKAKKRELGGSGPKTQEGLTLAYLSAPLTSLVSECGEGLRMGFTSLTC